MDLLTSEVGTETRLARIQRYLQEGWVIAPPVYIRPIWQTLKVRRDAYHFVLRREEQINLVVVPESPEVEHFLIEEQLPSDRL